MVPTDVDTPSRSGPAIPLTPGQRLILSGQGLSPDAPVYNMGWRFDLGSEIDPDRFAAAFARLVADADVLRMVIVEGEAGPCLACRADAAGHHRTLDPAPGTEDDTVADLLGAPFDLGRETFRSVLILGAEGWHWVFVQHHILTDAGSGEILFRALSDRYAADGVDAPGPLPAFGDWASGPGQATDADAAAYWAAQIADLPATPPVPYSIDRGAPATRTARRIVPLGAARSHRLSDLAADDRFAALTPAQTRFNLISTVVAAWLAKVTAADTALLGVTSHGRPNIAARQTPGLFMELLPLRLDLTEDLTMHGLHDHVVDRAGDLMMHAAPGAATAATHASFNVVLNVLPTRFGTFDGQPAGIDWLDHGHFDPRHALWVDVVGFDGPGDVTLHLRFNEGLFAPGRQAAAEAQILRALDQFLEEPDIAVASLALAGPEDAAFGLTRADPWAQAKPCPDVLSAFGAQVRAGPDRIVLTDDAGSMTRAALWDASAALAHDLAGRGIGPGDRVGVYLTRGRQLVTALLGIMRTGAAYVPLDPFQPTDRLRIIADEARLSLTVTERGLAATCPGTAPTVVTEDVADGPAPEAALPVAGAADAYVIFTSGTTGRPKGVRIGHAALSRYAHWAARSFGGQEPASWALHSAVGFDLTVTSIFAPLVSGGQIRAYRDALGVPDLSVLSVFEEDAVDVVKLTPAHLALVLREGKSLRRISALVLGGEALGTALARAAHDTFGPGVRLFNEYGPTEATVGCMVHRFDPEADRDGSVPVGRPAGDTAIYVLDRGGQPVPDHVIGEIAVAGPDRLACGYFDDADLTARMFPDNPHHAGARMYLTGDRAHVRGDGVLVYHGRGDDQVKIGGVRFEPAEIADALRGHPQVRDGAVIRIGAAAETPRRCDRCGLGSDHPDADIDASGQCRLCRDFAGYRARAQAYFRTMDDLAATIEAASGSTQGPYDCMMLLSGGKDSSYALGRLADLTKRVLAVTLDNGFISEGAKDNIAQVCAALGVDHRFMSTRHMNAIFSDSLERYANVCNGCFKTIYTLAMQLARTENIPLIVTGLSRGQLFETRLAPDLFGADGISSEQIDRNVLDARRTYHRVPDAAARLLNGDFFDDDRVFDDVQFVDFYRYCDVGVDEVYRYLDTRLPWLRPADTGRSTNCLINDVGIYVHRKRRGYHNYALPYSWDVRMGHKSRDAALAELDDDLDRTRIDRIMDQIGFSLDEADARAQNRLHGYYVADTDLDPQDLTAHMLQRLPRHMIPDAFVRVDALPLTPNGKVDKRALAAIAPPRSVAAARARQAPRNDRERLLAEIWGQVLNRADVGITDNFFEIGGDSVHAISIASRANRAGLPVTAFAILRDQTIAAVLKGVPDDAAQAADKDAARTRARVDDKTLSRLAQIFGTSGDAGQRR